MATVTEKIENLHRRQHAVDSARAARLGKDLTAYRGERADQVRRWAVRFRALMEAADVDDPAQILPEIMVEICEEATAHAVKTAEACAKVELQQLLRKAVSS